MSYVLGIDVSLWQDNISTPQKMNFNKSYEEGVRFAFIKASQRDFMDRDFIYNWDSAKRAGLLRGAYHFLTWDRSPKTQAKFFWSLLKEDSGELPAVLDFEYWGTVPSNAHNFAVEFYREFKSLTDKKLIIYTGAYFWSKYAPSNSPLYETDLWIASYTSQEIMERNIKNLTKWKTWTFWQFTDRLDGIKFGAESKQLDGNYFNGSLEDLYKYAGITIQKPEENQEQTSGSSIETPEQSIQTNISLKVLKPVYAREIPYGKIVKTRQINEIIKLVDIYIENEKRVWIKGDDNLWSALIYDNSLFFDKLN
ncbi:MAG: hypothetical protein KatS3mg002_1033 [Candidatus Woesearchaeota archaeon]|jgi:lysozyme|nr:MAG: hypothetical protein KatS3mg002_1033 [Candidatus Woesearchaeota archaeon]